MNREILPFSLIIIAFLVAFLVYPTLPDEVPSHWNAAGEIDGYMSQFWGAFLFPLIIAGVGILMWGVPKIAVFKKNIEAFEKYYYRFRVFLMVFFLYMYLITMGANFFEVRMNLFLIPAFSALFFFVSDLLKNAKRNFFIGIRTPWTLSSDEVWKKTHELGARTSKWLSVIILGAIFFPDYFLWFLVIPILVWAFGLMAYSYFEFQKEHKK